MNATIDASRIAPNAHVSRRRNSAMCSPSVIRPSEAGRVRSRGVRTTVRGAYEAGDGLADVVVVLDDDRPAVDGSTVGLRGRRQRPLGRGGRRLGLVVTHALGLRLEDPQR